MHDRILEAVYSMIPDDEKEQIHFNIGNLLLKVAIDVEICNIGNGLKEIKE